MSKDESCIDHNDEGLESQQITLLNERNLSRDRWRNIFLVLRASRIIISIYNTKKASLATDQASPATPYSVILTCTDTGLPDSELIGIESSPQVSIDVHESHTESNTERQQKNIAKIVKQQDLVSLQKFGGVQGIAEALDTDLKNGIPGSEEDICSRRKANTLSKTQSPRLGFFGLLLRSCNNYIIFLLLISAGMSLGFGIKMEGARTGWYEGVIIVLAVIILVVVPSLRDFWYANLQKFMVKEKLPKNREMVADVIRGGCYQQISVSEVVFGDIVCLKRGYQVPADGLFISGEFIDLDDGSESFINEQTPFLFYGAKVIDGNGHMLVTSVGANTAWGEIMSKVTHAPNRTTLQAQLDKMSYYTQIIGLIISILVPLVLFMRFKLGKEDHKSGLPELKGKPTPTKELMEVIKRIIMKPSGKLSNLTTSLTMLLVGVLEGLPFFITLAISYWNKKTLYCKAFAQKLCACVTMGSVTTICIDKTGGLTLNPLEVDMCWIGEEVISGDSIIAPEVLEALCDGIRSPLLNPQSHCSAADDPLLSWAAWNLGLKKSNMEILKQNCTIILATEIKSNDEEIGILMRKNGDNETTMRMYWKGPAARILSRCSFYYDIKGTTMVMSDEKRMIVRQQIDYMQSKHLKTIALAYKQTGASVLEEERDLILIGLLGLKHTCWIETRKSIKYCRNAGVNIKLISEDNVSVLTAVAEKCGMLMPDSNEVKLEAEDFRGHADDERMDIIDQIVVMGSSLPADRLLMVQCLRQKGHRVAVVGVRTAETPALKEADVGIAMGTWSTELARESSDIIIWDGDLSLLVSIIRTGRCAYENIRKYIQLQLTMTIAWLIISPTTTFFYGDAPITAVQWVWATLIVTLFGGLALLTEPPDQELMGKPPASATDPLITKIMWINIVTQALYQATILVTFLYKGQAILGIDNKVCNSMIFNSFVLCQVFNQFNARELENKNIFKGLHQNYFFWVAVGVILALQEAFTQIASILPGSARLSGKERAVCFLTGTISWGINWVVKCTSDFMTGRFIGSTGMTRSASTESTFNLELPLMST